MEIDCSLKCRSKNHVNEMVCAVTKGSLNQVKAYLQRCPNSLSLTNAHGMSVVLMAASCGKVELLEWLLEHGKVDVKQKDQESGWTVLHRALFYGQIDVARLFISQPGINLQNLDRDGLIAFDILTKDRPPYVSFTGGFNDTFSWGDNTNITLGHSNEMCRSHPEAIETFKRHRVSIIQVVMSKYHSVFLSSDGKVYTCGHGRGGRLGHGDELTQVLPKCIKSIQHEKCVAIAAGRDHSVFLMESNLVYTCGMNENHQLGHTPAPNELLSPKPLRLKMLKTPIIGIGAGRFHTFFYTSSNVYTFGLNAGQLGHQKEERLVTQPRIVSALNHSTKMAACSNAATVFLTSDGNLYVLHEYLCRKITSKWHDVRKILVMGGQLDHRSDIDILREQGGSQLVIILLDSSDRVFLWTEARPTLCRLLWSIKRDLYIQDVALSTHGFAITTKDGAGFIGKLPKQKKSSVSKAPKPTEQGISDSFSSMSLLDLLEKADVEDVQITRIPGLHRAINITCDPKGHNFIVTQAQPNSCLTQIPEVSQSLINHHFISLFDVSDELDMIHDVILEFGNQRKPAHKYILASRSTYFQQIFTDQSGAIRKDISRVTVENTLPKIFAEVLKFLYTDTCELLTVGTKFMLDETSLPKPMCESPTNKNSSNGFADDVIDANFEKLSAFAVREKLKKTSSVRKEKNSSVSASKNPIVLLKEAAKYYGIKSLTKKLEAVKYQNNCVQPSGKCLLPKIHIKFDRKILSGLCDVEIVCDDDVILHCHKCVLCARSEYFNSMLAYGSWRESSNNETLKLPIPGRTLEIVIDYLYTDECSSHLLKGHDEVELLCNVLVVADQLLLTRLKEICESLITQALTLKNAAELMEFASLYNASQLKHSCQEYICINLAAQLENRCLDVLSDEVMDSLVSYYKKWVKGMSRRFITPWHENPDMTTLEACEEVFSSSDLDFSFTVPPKQDDSAKKRRRRRSQSKSITEDKPATINSAEKQVHMLQSQISDELPETVQEFHVPERQDSVQSSLNTPTSPLAILPSADSIWNIPSPDSGNGLISLRDIMENESETTHTSPDSRAKQPRSAAKIKSKRSNKERKRQLFQHSDTEIQTAENEILKPRTFCPWGAPAIPAVTSPPVPSLKDVMDAEEKCKKEKASMSITGTSSGTTEGGGDTKLSWGLPMSQFTKKTAAASSNDVQAIISTPDNPWNLAQTKPCPSSHSALVNFAEIIKDEMAMKENMDRNMNKPLSLIQIEEQAMQELLIQYKAQDRKDECITVERVSSVMASPTWAATQQHRH
ncbi:inhibitor of Bruton tyrosine kinase-like [Tubulanus polymorphus]|uniref:inhibitor of Bruton tyrosine kinase-like n=1 Tax=Tubulanus polymorphus TaxID=672921 RepID=UPI003DA65C26